MTLPTVKFHPNAYYPRPYIDSVLLVWTGNNFGYVMVFDLICVYPIEILRDWSIKQIQLPTLEQHHLTGDLETGYNRILKFIRGHHPSGHEADVAHKRDVVRYLALNEMLQECQNAKVRVSTSLKPL